MRLFAIFFAGIILFGFPSGVAFAYNITQGQDIPVFNDFVVGPTRHEFFLKPGQTGIVEISVMNRLGREMQFKIGVEDFTGSYDPEQTVVLLGDTKGPYSLKDYVKPEITEFTLSHGQKIYFKVEVAIPEDAQPGGRYGALIVSTNPSAPALGGEPDSATAGIQIKTRIASLFFVRVAGEVEEKGFLKSFQLTNRPRQGFYNAGPIKFGIAFQNDGSVHLVPYGIIEIRNLLGKKVGEVKVDPYFAMPSSLRTREVSWDKSWLFGGYKATLFLNRGYKDVVDQMSLSFWVIPWKVLLAIVVVAVIFALFFWFVVRKIEIRVKK
jgi:hypothetical protein